MTAEEAESAKRAGGLPENFEPEVLQPFIEKLVLEVQRALQFFFTSTQYNKVDHILLAGGSRGDRRARRGGQHSAPRCTPWSRTRSPNMADLAARSSSSA